MTDRVDHEVCDKTLDDLMLRYDDALGEIQRLKPLAELGRSLLEQAKSTNNWYRGPQRPAKVPSMSPAIVKEVLKQALDLGLITTVEPDPIVQHKLGPDTYDE